MRYVCFVHIDPDLIGMLSPEEDKAQQRESIAFDEELTRSGHMVAAHPIQDAETATVIRHRNGRISMTDGPYVESKEHLGGFFVLEAKDLNEALSLASKAPVARYGSVEVRPTWDLEPGPVEGSE
jgi:hypothetical protein